MFPDGYYSVVFYGQNSLPTTQNLVFHFSAHVYNLFEDLAKIIMGHTNFTSSEVIVLETDDPDFAIAGLFYICR